MKQESTEEVMERLKRDARQGAVFQGIWSAAKTVLLAFVAFRTEWSLILRVPAGVLLAISLIQIPFSVFAHRRRMEEIEGGEEIEARKY